MHLFYSGQGLNLPLDQLFQEDQDSARRCSMVLGILINLDTYAHV